MSAVEIGTGRLTLEDVVRVARGREPISPLAAEVVARVAKTAAWVAGTVDRISTGAPKAYYGINTGFGARAGRTALDSPELTKLLGRNLIASHSVGVGPYFDESVVRAALLIRAQSLAQGYSGVRAAVIETLIRMLNEGVYPAVPEQGSLGASGDLAPLAHLLLVITEMDGEAFVPGDGAPAGLETHHHVTEDYTTGRQILWRRVSSSAGMRPAGGKVELQAKEALALVNGSTFSVAIGALVLRDALNLLDHTELALAMTLEGSRGFRDPFYPHLHRARGHAAAEHTASRVLSYVEGSQLLDPGDLRTNPQRIPPQDPYSIRCAPQVHGSVADTLQLARRWVEMDLNAATDNPLIFLELERDYKTMSGGNFHGEPIALAMDFTGIAMTELGSMSDRRMFHLMTGVHGLPDFLMPEPPDREGLNCGLMMLQATAAALVSDCKTLAHPDTVDSIPSSGNQEDHVSMSLNAARHARDIAANVEQIVAMELLCAAQAIALHRLRPGAGTGAALRTMREEGIAELVQDRVLYPDIRKAVRLLRNGKLIRAAREASLEVTPC